MEVKTFIDKELKESIKNFDPIIQQYIKAQKKIIDIMKETQTQLLIKYKKLYNEHDLLKEIYMLANEDRISMMKDLKENE